MPVHTAYAVPIGSTRNGCDMHQKLAAVATTIAVFQANRVNPSNCFSGTTQTTSSAPAAASRS